MAEVIGLISGLYTVGKAGLNLYDTLTSFAEGIQTAERDVSLVAYEIKSTSEVLLLIRDSLQESRDSKSRAIKQGRRILEGLATQCEYCHDLIKKLISFLKPYFDESKCSSSKELVRFGHRHKHVKLLDKWRWQKQRPKVDKLRGYLEALKSNLGLVLPILRYEIAEEKRAPALTRESLKETIETALREARSHPREVTQALVEDVEAAKSTSKALISRRESGGTPQDAIQELAADIVFSGRQRRPYVRRRSNLNGATPSRGFRDGHRRMLSETSQQIWPSTNVNHDDDSDTEGNQNGATTSRGFQSHGSRPRLRPVCPGKHLPWDDDIIDDHPVPGRHSTDSYTAEFSEPYPTDDQWQEEEPWRVTRTQENGRVWSFHGFDPDASDTSNLCSEDIERWRCEIPIAPPLMSGDDEKLYAYPNGSSLMLHSNGMISTREPRAPDVGSSSRVRSKSTMNRDQGRVRSRSTRASRATEQLNYDLSQESGNETYSSMESIDYRTNLDRSPSMQNDANPRETGSRPSESTLAKTFVRAPEANSIRKALDTDLKESKQSAPKQSRGSAPKKSKESALSDFAKLLAIMAALGAKKRRAEPSRASSP